MIIAAALCVLSASPFVVEPATGEPLPESIEVDGSTYGITGADVRRVIGKDAYALAHYLAGGVEVPGDSGQAVSFLAGAPVGKALLFRGTHAIPARGIRWSWRKSLNRVDYDGALRNEFIDAFALRFEVGTVLLLITDGDERLRAIQDGQLLGEWREKALVRAVWDVALGQDAEVVNRLNMASRRHLTTCEECDAAIAARYADALEVAAPDDGEPW